MKLIKKSQQKKKKREPENHRNQTNTLITWFENQKIEERKWKKKNYEKQNSSHIIQAEKKMYMMNWRVKRLIR